MKKWTWVILIVLTLGFVAAGLAAADQFVVCPPDVKKRKALCALMIRYGRDALARYQFDQARQFFQKAVQADPSSRLAWAYYNRALVLSLSWQFKKTGRFFDPKTAPKLTPSTPTGAQPPAAKPTAKPARKPAAPAGAPVPPPEPDEGC